MRFRFPSELKSRLLAATGLLRAAERAAQGAAILMYHGVLERLHGDALDEYCLTADELRAHVQFLKAHGSIVPLMDIIDRLRSGQPVPNDWFVLTFDDALRCQATLARDVLAGERVPWTLSVPTDVVEQRRVVWTYEVRLMVLGLYREPAIDLPGWPSRTLPTRTDKERLAAASAIVDALAAVGDRACRNAYVAQLLAHVGPQRLTEALAEDGRFVSADWDEIRSLDHAGVEILAHGAAHVLQHAAMSPDELQWEICGSRRLLEQRLGRPPLAFALPGGRRAPLTDQLVRAAGYAGCLGSRPERVTAGADPYDLPRFDAAFSLPTLRRRLTQGATA